MLDQLVASGMIPDIVLRKSIRHLLQQRLKDEMSHNPNLFIPRKQKLIEELKTSPVAIETDKANDQHYMVDPEFFRLSLGQNLKYSCCHWDEAKNLDEAELEMLELTIKRAQIQDGDKILELGHGWGAITLFMAQRFPQSEILAVSNSKSQGEYILERARARGLTNIRIQTADMAHFDTSEKFDRIVSVEMFEHMRNYPKLFKNISRWLNDRGTLFVHIFCHKELAYKFEVKDQTDWMSKYFFSGGIMPSADLYSHYSEHMQIKEQYIVNGKHYAKTCRAWLNNMDKHKENILNIFAEHYPRGEAKKWFHYWRIFYMSCEELFAFNQGREWYVGHYLFTKK